MVEFSSKYTFNGLVCCGVEAEKTICESHTYAARCPECGRHVVGSTPEEAVFKWYGLVPEREADAEIEQALRYIFERLGEQEVPASKLSIPAGPGGRRAMSLLVEAGIASARYLADGEEVGIREAIDRKKEGASVEAFVRVAFEIVSQTESQQREQTNG